MMTNEVLAMRPTLFVHSTIQSTYVGILRYLFA